TATADVVADVMNTAGLNSDAMLKAIKDDAIKQQLIEQTGLAVEQGLFGVPTMIVNGEFHFGQDRLDWVERQLLAQQAG
ncbi:MAG: DsbA family protein, partial [Pseudomonadota bacterium]